MLITISDIEKRFGTVRAVDGVSLELAAGQILCLAGASGSGKSTLLRILAGFETPDHGSIRLAGETIVDDHHCQPPEKRGIGMVFQDYALFPHLTVAKNIAFGLRGLPRKERNARVDEMLDMVELADVGKRFPHQLSGGQRQRIAIARALAPSPKLVLLDEAFSSLDRVTRVSVLDEVRKLLKSCGATAICVTHDVDDALVLADQLALLHAGKLLQVGTPRELYESPSSLQVAQFFGTTNIFFGTPQDGSLETVFGSVGMQADADTETQMLSIRPQDLEIVSADQGTCSKVEHVCFQGHCQELTISLAKAPDHRYKVQLDAATPVSPGDCLHVQPKLDKIRVLQATAES